MGIQQSKDELLYQQVNYGNIEGIKTLRSEGAGLEWMDKEGKTPLIVACMNPELYNVARALIELGANVNAYRPGRHAGTPLHHAAKRGLDQTVKLLLLHGANALVINDDCQTPLDVARIKGFSNVVRTIEAHICLFSGWLKELYGPSFLEILAPKFLSRKVWVVVIPCGSRNLRKPFKLELAIYTNIQDAQPRTIVALWKANMEQPNFNQPEPAVIISDTSTIPRRWRRRRGITYNQVRRQTRLKIAALSETEKQQLQWFCDACKGIPQVMHSTFPFNTQGPVFHATAPPNAEDVELAMAIDASLQSSSRVNSADVAISSDSSNPVDTYSQKANTSGHDVSEASSSGVTSHIEAQNVAADPSAPPAVDDVIEDGPIHYPTIDDAPIDLSSPPGVVSSDAKSVERKDSESSSSCVICLDAPVEGACIPCGHMAGCMSCLNEIKAKHWGCPVCRAKIVQVVRLYAV